MKIVTAVLVGVLLLYLSPFWALLAWFWAGIDGLKGNTLSFWLRGTQLQPYSMIVWVLGAFLVLTWTEKLVGWVTQKLTGEGN